MIEKYILKPPPVFYLSPIDKPPIIILIIYMPRDRLQEWADAGTVNMPIMGQQSIAIPEFFATPTKNGYKLVNPMTQERNLSKRGHQLSIRLIRKPVEHMILMEHSTEPISLAKFSKKDRAIIDKHFDVIEQHKHKDVGDIPLSKKVEVKERGRPETLPANIRINRERDDMRMEDYEAPYVPPKIRRVARMAPPAPPALKRRTTMKPQHKPKPNIRMEIEEFPMPEVASLASQQPKPAERQAKKTSQEITDIIADIQDWADDYRDGFSEAQARELTKKITAIKGVLPSGWRKYSPDKQLELIGEVYKKNMEPKKRGVKAVKEGAEWDKKRAGNRASYHKKKAEKKDPRDQGQEEAEREVWEKVFGKDRPFEKGVGKFAKGKGINEMVAKLGKSARSVGNKLLGEKTTAKIEQYGNAVAFGRNDYPPKVRDLLSRYGNDMITSAEIRRSPVPSLISSALNAVSLGAFKKNMANAPYDSLFHLQFAFTTASGKFLVEKNEVINMDKDPVMPPKTEVKPVTPMPLISLQHLMDATKAYMGDKMFGYSARDNNCQDFVMAILNGNNIGNEQDRAFTKQPTSQLFEGLTTLNRVSNAVTNLGADINTITTGAGIDKDWEHIKWGSFTKQFNAYNKHHQPLKDLEEFAIMILKEPHKYQDKTLKRARFYKNVLDKKNKISRKGIMPKFAKGSKEAKDYMASIRAKRGKGITHHRRGSESESDSDREEGRGIAEDVVKAFTKKSKGGNLKDYLNDKVWSKIPEAYHAPIEQIGRQGIKDLGFGIGTPRSTVMRRPEGGNLKDYLNDKVWSKIPEAYHAPIEQIGRQGIKDLGFGITIHQHHHHHHYPQGEGFIDDLKNAFDPKKNGVAKAFEPGGSAEKFGREVGHYGIPALTGALGGLAGTALGGLATGGAGGEFAGGVAGSALGSKAGQEINKMAGLGFKKGSQEAKDHMARIRAMRRK